jgi:hypothetical protein
MAAGRYASLLHGHLVTLDAPHERSRPLTPALRRAHDAAGRTRAAGRRVVEQARRTCRCC